MKGSGCLKVCRVKMGEYAVCAKIIPIRKLHPCCLEAHGPEDVLGVGVWVQGRAFSRVWVTWVVGTGKKLDMTLPGLDVTDGHIVREWHTYMSSVYTSGLSVNAITHRSSYPHNLYMSGMSVESTALDDEVSHVTGACWFATNK